MCSDFEKIRVRSEAESGFKDKSGTQGRTNASRSLLTAPTGRIKEELFNVL